MKRQDVINDLIAHDVDAIMEDHPERTLTELLESGCKGYTEWLTTELEELYNDIFKDDADDIPIKIEQD